MALTKKQVKEILSAAGVDAEHMAEAVDAIMEGHIASVDALREERDSYKADAEKLPEVQKELDGLKLNSNGDSYKQLYEDEVSKNKKLQQQFDNFKADTKARDVLRSKEEAYRSLLAEAGIPEKRITAVLKVSELDKIELVDGQIKDSETVIESIKKEWAGLIPETKKRGANVNNPPDGNEGGDFEGMSLADKMAYANENPDSEEVRAWLTK